MRCVLYDTLDAANDMLGSVLGYVLPSPSPSLSLSTYPGPTWEKNREIIMER